MAEKPDDSWKEKYNFNPDARVTMPASRTGSKYFLKKKFNGITIVNSQELPMSIHSRRSHVLSNHLHHRCQKMNLQHHVEVAAAARNRHQVIRPIRHRDARKRRSHTVQARAKMIRTAADAAGVDHREMTRAIIALLHNYFENHSRCKKFV